MGEKYKRHSRKNIPPARSERRAQEKVQVEALSVERFLRAFSNELVQTERVYGNKVPVYTAVGSRGKEHEMTPLERRMDAVRQFLHNGVDNDTAKWGMTILSEAITPFMLLEVYGPDTPTFPLRFSIANPSLDASYREVGSIEHERRYQKGGDCLVRQRSVQGYDPAFLIDVTLRHGDIHKSKLLHPGMNCRLGVPVLVLPLTGLQMRVEGRETDDFQDYMIRRARKEVVQKGTIMFDDDDVALLRRQIPRLLHIAFDDCIGTLVPTPDDSPFMVDQKRAIGKKAQKWRSFFSQL